MSTYRIDANLPFPFCVHCKRKDLESDKVKSGEPKLFQEIRCKSEAICCNAIALRNEYDAETK